MVPRPDIVALPVALSPQAAMEQVLQHPYTRYPVYDEEFDDVLGVLHVRRLFVALQNGAAASSDLRALLYPAYLVPETKRLGHLLDRDPPHRRATWRSSWTNTARLPASSRSRTCSRRSSARSTTSSTPRTLRSCAWPRSLPGRGQSPGRGVQRALPLRASRTRTTTPSAAIVFGELGRAPPAGRPRRDRRPALHGARRRRRAHRHGRRRDPSESRPGRRGRRARVEDADDAEDGAGTRT